MSAEPKAAPIRPTAERMAKGEKPKRKLLSDDEVAKLAAKGVPVVDYDAEKAGPPVERPTRERIAQGGIKPNTEARGEKAKPWNADECLVDVYFASGTITKRQAMAGYDFRALWYRAHGASVRAAPLQARISGGTLDMSDSAEAAVSQLKLLAAKYGSDIFSCLRSVVGLGESASHWAKARGEWPAGGRLALRMSLNRHADHLKLPDEP